MNYEKKSKNLTFAKKAKLAETLKNFHYRGLR
jgi:hypothetical protein